MEKCCSASSGGVADGCGRGGDSGEVATAIGSAEAGLTAAATVNGAEGTVGTTEPPSRRQEPEVVVVPMDAEQELVYGWLGLNPVLLLDPSPAPENLVVRVVRPGEDSQAVLEDARQQLASSGGRRRRRGRGGPAASAAGPESLSTEADAVGSETIATETPHQQDSHQDGDLMAISLVANQADPVAAAAELESIDPPANDDSEESSEPRRRRRRSSASA